jgi:hypothetical protein
MVDFQRVAEVCNRSLGQRIRRQCISHLRIDGFIVELTSVVNCRVARQQRDFAVFAAMLRP